MNGIIRIDNGSIGGEQCNTVNARYLHAFLEVGKDFSNWIKAQIERARLVEGCDFVVLEVSAQKGENSKGGRPTKEYHLTLEAGKHVGMMSGTDKGFEVRDYFIECERKAKQPALNPANLSRLQLIEMAMQAEQERLQLENKVAEQAPKVAALELLTESDGASNLINTAGMLGKPCKVLTSYLVAERWIYKRPGSRHYAAFSDRLRAGLLELKPHTGYKPDGSMFTSEQVLITPKGLSRLAQVFTQGAQR